MRIGIDVGGTKIEITALADDNRVLWRERTKTPHGDYRATIHTIRDLVHSAESVLGTNGSVGLAIPGTISEVTGLVKNANSTALIGHPLDKDMQAALERPVRVANDANCFALSEAKDGAADGHDVVFGVILGTGVGGGICVGGRVLKGAHAIAGEWGHNPLPWPAPEEQPGPACYCGRHGCIETWCSGPALTRRFRVSTGRTWSPTEIDAAADSGDPLARAAVSQYLDRLARALSIVVNIVDPDAIVLGGGLSNIRALYRELPERVAGYAFTPELPARILKNVHGDSSGVRGAAWLWPLEEVANGLPA